MAVYVGVRDLAGAMFVGSHQYIVFIPDTAAGNMRRLPRSGRTIHTVNLGKGKMGFSIAGHNINGRLRIKINETSDLKAIKEAITGKAAQVLWDWDAELHKVTHNTSDKEFIELVLRKIDIYTINEQANNIAYGPFGNNCNKFAQSVIQYAGGKVVEDMGGIDYNHSGRFPRKLFNVVTPAAAKKSLKGGAQGHP